MSDTIITKHSGTSGVSPALSEVTYGELAVNIADGIIYCRTPGDLIIPITVANGAITMTKISATGTPSASTYLRGDGTWSTVSGGSGTVTSITAGTGLTGGTITTSGTLAVSYGSTAGTVCEGNDSRLTNSRAPTGSAGGDLTGTYPNPTIANSAVTVAKISATGTPSATTYLRGDGAWATVSGGGFAPVVTDFASSGSYTIPSGATNLQIFCCGGGGGGGSGFFATTGNKMGGGGGGGGSFTQMSYLVSDIGGTGTALTVTVGSNGIGGTGSTSSGVAGTSGTSGGASIVRITSSSSVLAYAGYANGGSAGNATTGGNGGSPLSAKFSFTGGIGQTGGMTLSSPLAPSQVPMGAQGGGGGAGAATSQGLNGGPCWAAPGAADSNTTASNAGGNAPSGNGNNATTLVAYRPGGGGSGGASSHIAAGGNGGNGISGGGGGGGGAGGATKGGNGGNGGTGFVRIIAT